MISLAWRCFATALSIYGALGVSSRRAGIRMFGFLIWIVGNSIWFVNSVSSKDLPQSFLWLVFSMLWVRGAINNYYSIKEEPNK